MASAAAAHAASAGALGAGSAGQRAAESEVDIGAVLQRVGELHASLSNAIERCLCSTLPAAPGSLNRGLEGPGGSGASRQSQAEVRVLLEARDALEDLEEHLELYQMCPATHRDVALRALEEKRRKLALCLYRHNWDEAQEAEVVADLMAFIGEDGSADALADEDMPLPLPPYSHPIVPGTLLPGEEEDIMDPTHPRAISFQMHQLAGQMEEYQEQRYMLTQQQAQLLQQKLRQQQFQQQQQQQQPRQQPLFLSRQHLEQGEVEQAPLMLLGGSRLGAPSPQRGLDMSPPQRPSYSSSSFSSSQGAATPFENASSSSSILRTLSGERPEDVEDSGTGPYAARRPAGKRGSAGEHKMLAGSAPIPVGPGLGKQVRRQRRVLAGSWEDEEHLVPVVVSQGSSCSAPAGDELSSTLVGEEGYDDDGDDVSSPDKTPFENAIVAAGTRVAKGAAKKGKVQGQKARGFGPLRLVGGLARGVGSLGHGILKSAQMVLGAATAGVGGSAKAIGRCALLVLQPGSLLGCALLLGAAGLATGRIQVPPQLVQKRHKKKEGTTNAPSQTQGRAASKKSAGTTVKQVTVATLRPGSGSPAGSPKHRVGTFAGGEAEAATPRGGPVRHPHASGRGAIFQAPGSAACGMDLGPAACEFPSDLAKDPKYRVPSKEAKVATDFARIAAPGSSSRTAHVVVKNLGETGFAGVLLKRVSAGRPDVFHGRG